MNGLMMDDQLTITSIMQHADKVYGDVEIVSVTKDVPLHRYTYRDAFKRVRQLANAFSKLDLASGDRIATLAWNDFRHFELYYGVSCSGFVCHTINPRLHPEQITYLLNHAKDQWLFLDPLFLPIVEGIKDHVETVKGFVVLTDAEHMPDTSLPNCQSYEEFIGNQPDTFDWPEFDERTASSLCYTSGTTGNPKGVLYSHRSTLLHALATLGGGVLQVSPEEVVMPIVPMFHVNAWGLTYSVPMSGAKLVLPGPKMGDGETLCKLINSEGVTYSAGVPTVWLALVNYLDQSGETVETFKYAGVGGAACPLSIMKGMERHGVWVAGGWGMTETSPLGATNAIGDKERESASGELLDVLRVRTGQKIFGVDMRIVDEEGNELPWDGKTPGELQVKGPWVASAYYELDNPGSFTDDGWFGTGDVAVIDKYGSMNITDRTKDVIKSGGEWVSSIDVENAAMAHPDVLEAAVIGVPSDKWTERPYLIVVPREGAEPDGKAIIDSLEGKIAKWWTPDDCVFVDELPHTATGKVSKKDLREQFKHISVD